MIHYYRCFSLWVLLLVVGSMKILMVRSRSDETSSPDPASPAVEYGVDISFPMQHGTVSTNYPWLPHNVDPNNHPLPAEYKGMPLQPLGDRQTFYQTFLQSCIDYFNAQPAHEYDVFSVKGGRCRLSEEDRIRVSLTQPRSMQNYTSVGFKKIRAPQKVFNLLRHFWDLNKGNGKPEEWGVGNTYTNNWQVPINVVSVEDTSLRGGGDFLRQQIWDDARNTIQEWTQQELTESSLFGIRVYHSGAILSPHVDRLPLVSSAIINVDQDVDEPWPLEVIGHDGKAYNVTMEPGDMVLYESHSILHGRPFPLKGRFMANIFIHFEPTGHSLRHDARIAAENQQDGNAEQHNQSYDGNRKADVSKGEIPPYLLKDSPEAIELLAENQDRLQREARTQTIAPVSSAVHDAAHENDLGSLQKLVEKEQHLVHAKDENGWTPLHEGASEGNIEIVKFLLEKNADVNARSGHDNSGGSVLWWAKNEAGEDHPVVTLLIAAGALEIEPEL